MRSVGGIPSVSCIIDRKTVSNTESIFSAWVRMETLILRFQGRAGDNSVFRWMFEPVLDTIKLPKD
jgi:hypothetical protein